MAIRLDLIDYQLITLSLLIFVAGHFIDNNAYAEDPFGIQKGINDAFDGFADFITDINDSTDLSESQKERIDTAINSGTHAGKSMTNSWFAVHEAFIDIFLAGSPIPLHVGIITIISMGITFTLIFLFLRELWKKAKWIFFAIAGVIVTFLVLGINPQF